MDNRFSFNLIRIDVKNIKTVEDCHKILVNNNINYKDIDPNKLFEAKKKHDSLFFDDKTLFLFAYIKKGSKDITFVYDLVDMMKEIKEINDKTLNETELTLDFILDKINKLGYNSLTEKEKSFLKISSKK